MTKKSSNVKPDDVPQKLRQDIERLLKQYLPLDLPFNSPVSAKSKVVHDGLWGTLRLSPTEICFLDTPLVQRLRQIHQMGCSYFTYPSTTHSRLEHTLGVMLQVRKLGEALLKSPNEKRLSEQDIAHMRLAALLHDIGHGPFSHTSEEVFGILPAITRFHSKHPSHEALTYLILTSERFRLFSAKVSDRFKEEIPIEEIAKYIIGECTDSPRPYKRELLNGPFDAIYSGIAISVVYHFQLI